MTARRILVTAVGGPLGHWIAEIVKGSGRGYYVVGTDPRIEHTAVFDGCIDEFVEVPPAGDPQYGTRLAAICGHHDIDFIIPGCEAELAWFVETQNRSVFNGHIAVVMANEDTVRIGLDKLETARFLEKHGLPHPWTVDAETMAPLHVPCVLKARSGSGKGIRYVESLEEARRYVGQTRAIFQERLTPPDEEYTCGLFRGGDGDVRVITMRRWLRGDLTWRAVVIGDEVISQLLAALATGLNLRGSINVQLMRTARGPVPFEINPRFSSTVSFRHAIGFQDVLWSIDDLEGGSTPVYEAPVGTRLFRSVRDLIVRPAR